MLSEAPSINSLLDEVALVLSEHCPSALATCHRLTDDIESARVELSVQIRAGSQPQPSLARRCRELCALSDALGSILEHTISLRLHALAGVQAALTRLHRFTTVEQLLSAAAIEFGESAAFDRVVISRGRETELCPTAVWISPALGHVAAQSTRALLTQTIAIGEGDPEVDMARRVAGGIVSVNPDASANWARVLGSTGYIACPLVSTSRLIGFIHADAPRRNRTLGPDDLDHVTTFAEGLGLLFQRTLLLERLVGQRARARDAFAVAQRRLHEMADDEVRLVESERNASAISARSAAIFRDGSDEDVADDLTLREREVIEMMLTGARTVEIAEQLRVGEGTVKTHIRNAKQKLGAANRADVVARYLRHTLRAAN
jgi:DNA-binding CsgD family transcriptional regulator/GAF domain-containing protein